ncbi:MAG: class I SAM-dependent methyltransferase [Candidatus Riflebacteria bacterium]|nr:class I SAM-dependent methyltransferase [Candidatus Riflebacteria bacterium]
MRNNENLSTTIRRYYRVQSKIYDLTRPFFLSGRRKILEETIGLTPIQKILEVGCGTGANFHNTLKKYPESKVLGLDLSEDMLSKALKKVKKFKNRVDLVQGMFPECLNDKNKFDMILFSYSLSMMGLEVDSAIKAAQRRLENGGLIAVVDFCETSFKTVKCWLGLNGVTIDGTIEKSLSKYFAPVMVKKEIVFMGLWKHIRFVGRKV